ncbi:MAG TPA: uracil-DNA glycosylase family protein [Gemmatimonadaceae bacterium]
MDAKEQLRRYLEQRRELGETELVLDRMTIEETLSILGARGAPAASSPRESAPTAARDAHGDPPRESVREAQPESPRDVFASRRDDAPVGDVDWRAALRAAGASPGSPPKKTTTKSDASESPSSEPTSSANEPSEAEINRRGAFPMKTPVHAAVAGSHVDAPAGINVGTPAAEVFGELANLDTLEKVASHISSCTRCTLYSTATNHVPGEGNPNADFMCVGEAPGATEDETGRPFVGAAGQLLTKILAAINLKREDVYICNVLKHRPPGNRNPRPEEVIACSPYLIRQIELIKPKVILALGTFAAQTLLDTKLSIGKLRGQVHRYYGVPLVVTYHPAALLRNPGWKRPTWEDVQLAHRILNSAAESNSGA